MVKRIPAKQISAWSFSRYADYKLCPLKAKLKIIDRIKEPANEAMERGANIHTLAENYIKGKISRLPSELKSFSADFKKLRAQYKKKINGMSVEDTWAFTKDWDETTWDDWTHCWVRIKLDCAHHLDDVTLVINDWKTGKYRPEQHEDYIEQLELYATGALLQFPHIEIVHPQLVYLDEGFIFPESDFDKQALTFYRKDLPRLKKTWTRRVRLMLNDKTFAPRPNDKCRWCFFRADNKASGGGQCKY